MTVHTLICPRCGQRLTVTDQAPRFLTCPRCLSAVDNSTAAGQPAPRPVIPLETQVRSDTRFAAGASILVTIVAIIGVIAIVFRFGPGPISWIVIAMLLLGAGVAWAASGFPLWGNIKPQSTGSPGPSHPVVPPGVVELPATLDYRGLPSHRLSATYEPTNYLAAIGGFFLAIAICAAGFFFLAYNVGNLAHSGSSSAFPLIIVLGAITASIVFLPRLGKRPGWSGFNPGIAIGLGLGMLALGPCGFCYLITTLG